MIRTPSAMLPLRKISSPPRVANPFSLTTYTLMVAGCLAGVVMLGMSPAWALFVAAMMFGWSEIDGLCGSSHVCALTPLRVMESPRALWLKAVSAYTVGGLITSACVGGLLGFFGLVIISGSSYFLVAIAALALILAARELEWIRFRLPQVHRQTNKMWAFEFGFITAGSMWGAHIGLGFATVVTHGGFLVLVAFSVILGPLHGALLMATYWLGRTLPIWTIPTLTANHGDAAALSDLVLTDTAAYRHLAAAGLLCSATVALMLV